MNNGYMQWNERFDRAIRLKVPYRDALTMETYAKQLALNPPDYKAVEYNCQSFVNEIFGYGGVALFTDTESLVGVIVSNSVYTTATRYIRGGSAQPVAIQATDRIQFDA